jgi:AAA15 family ATPase/GTPase
MLIRFVVENFLSFKGEAVLDMIATKDEEQTNHIFKEEQGKEVPILRVAALYGANASGKSNLVQAIHFAQELITKGTKGDQAIPVVPFRLDKDTLRSPSRFEFTIRYKGDIYTYGFKVSGEQVLEEWLFVTSNKREVRYFERINTKEGKVKVEFGPSLSGKNKSSKYHGFLVFVVQGTRANQLFLTEAVDRNVEKVKPLMDWFNNVLQVITAESIYSPLEIRAHRDKPFTDFLGNFLRNAGTGIEGITTVNLPLDFDKQLQSTPEKDKQEIRDSLLKGSGVILSTGGKQYGVTLGEDKQPILVGLKTQHRTSDGQIELFDIEDESEGTQRLIHLIPALATSKSSEKVWIIDELDRRLHPLLSRMFVEAYLDCGDAPQRGQMIFTTHDTNLLDSDLLRKDEVWFIEKDSGGASHLYSLAEFKIRQGLKIEKGYLNGRFGAIPFIGDACKLGWEPAVPQET